MFMFDWSALMTPQKATLDSMLTLSVVDPESDPVGSGSGRIRNFLPDPDPESDPE